MDDLDHSIHIAEYDWTSFYEDSEECCLLQPLLACPDDSSLSDAEASEGSAFSRGPQETQQSSDMKGRDGTESSAQDLRDLSVQLSAAEEDRLTQTDRPAGNILDTEGETSDAQNSGESEELNGSDGKSTVGLCSGSQTELNEPHSEAVVDVSTVSLRAEKERWFVTVNDRPARQRLRAASVKKKRKQKKTCEGIHTCRPRAEESADKEVKLDINKAQCEEGRDAQSKQNSDPSDEESRCGWAISDSSQASGEDDEPIIDTSAPTSHDRSTPPHTESVESDEIEDSAEFLSIHSNDSESYMSAAESVEEPQHPLQDHLQQLHCSLSLMCDSQVLSLTTQSSQIHSYDSTHSGNEAATSCDHEPSLAFPSASQTATEMPDDDSTCNNDTHSMALCVPADTPVLQKHKMNLLASGNSQEDQLSPLPVPDFTIKPCSVADSPETYARAAGHTRPVYAISAFWEEMEKLTINDILYLRMGRSTPPKETHETVTPTADPNPSLVVDTSSDSALMDTSDSDYFTQTDESKPDHSSCEFSTSDFEEEYWQFLGVSRNTTPDPHDRNQHWTTDSEGRETPVHSEEDLSGRCLDNQESQTPSRRMTKSKSMHNVQALSKEGLSLLGNDEVFLSRCPPLEENTVLKVSGSLGTLIPASLLHEVDSLDYQKSLPEELESLFTEDNTKTSSVTFYDPENISVAPVFDCETLTSSLQRIEEKLIPIFTSSHPTVRELTFPKPDFIFLTANCEEMDDISPFRVASHSFIQADQDGANSWKSLLSIRKIRFHDKGSVWCRRSGDWMFPEESERISTRREDPVVTVFSEGRVGPASPQLLQEIKKQQILEAFTKEGIFSTLKQSDMCLVCIAFASWVLRSSDPEAADAWKAALLANVSALSAIQYLRQYMKRRNPPGQEL